MKNFKSFIARKSIALFLWAIDKNEEEYHLDIHRKVERARKARKRKEKRKNNNLNLTTS